VGLPASAASRNEQGERADHQRPSTQSHFHREDTPSRQQGTTASGLVAYLGGQPVGWCAVEPRSAYPRMLRNNRVPWEGRSEDKADSSVWAVTCFVTRAGFRRHGIAYALTREAVEFARQRSARAVEGYPMTTKDALLGELHVGTRGMFSAAGFMQVSQPSVRRVVMRIEF
jgi:GNAT superfamily N-acetyltransferase